MKINGSATVMPVRDVEAALRFYTDVLGFTERFRLGNYAGVERDECQIHLCLQGNPNVGPAGAGSVYVFCDEVDEYYRETTSRGASSGGPPRDYDYGMRDFVISDPDGNKVSFGCPVNKG